VHSAAGRILKQAYYLTDATNNDGLAALHVAAQEGNFEVAKFLVTVVSFLIVNFWLDA
jgi:ankyrin repeat protein